MNRTLRAPRSPLTFHSLSILALAVAISACSGPAGLDRTGPLDPSTVMAAVDARNGRLRTMEGSGTISVETPELSNSGNILVRVLKPDSMFVDITGPFGVGVAKGLITSSVFTFYNGMDNTVMQGTTSAKTLRSVLRMPVEFRDIMGVVSGSLGFHNAPAGVAPTVTRGDRSYRMVYASAEGSVQYDVDLDYTAITRFVRRSSAGDVLEDIEFRDFRKRSDLYLPSIVSLTRPPDQNLTVIYDRQAVNPTPLDFAFRIPKTATKIRL